MLEKITEYVFDDEYPARQVLFCSASSLGSLPAALSPLSRPFVLFIAADASSVTEQTVLLVAEKLLSQGMIYACVWGQDCERVHDLLDAASVQRNPSVSNANVVMTTWHAEETIEEAVWFFLNCAWPAAAYEQTCDSWVAAVIGNAEWEKSVKEEILRFDED